MNFQKKPLSGSWREKESFIWPPGSDNKAARVFEHTLIPLRVLISLSEMQNGDNWYHLSVSRPDRLPSWDELLKVKSDFLGDTAQAIHMLPKKEDYVNVHRFCLHLWAPADSSLVLPNLNKITWESSPE